ncbi:MAG: bifunctional ornithine acetyltransferase/N-acetylglutamate synthase, partial [Chitinivibrionales bacterium]|nr:bifunctional ornithine acetyltransferase/N-acetylglutamate synthase [Chitinivibrionales bacterium]
MEKKHIREVAGGITAAAGFFAAGVESGLKTSGDADMALLASNTPCSAGGAFTTNKVRASCVTWCEAVLPSGKVRGLLCLSGNANACTGKQGQSDTAALARLAGNALQCPAREVLIACTGIIGHCLPMRKIAPSVARVNNLLAASAAAGTAFARTIMTTDTAVKQAACRITLAGKKTVTIGGCAKGAGMIAPNMATMLALITSDAGIAPRQLDRMVKRQVDRTFNNLSIDGDTSTNDMALV